MKKPLETLRATSREVYLLKHMEALLGWDQETCMPSRAVTERADQIALLRGIIHQRIVSCEIREALAAPETSPREEDDGFSGEARAAFIRLWRRRYDRAIKIPQSLVERLARAASIAQARWAEAREAADFGLFRPHLEEVLDCVRETAARIGYAEHPYDALLDEYEPYMRTRTVDTLFAGLRRELVPLVRKVSAAPQVRDDFLYGEFPVEAQKAFCKEVLHIMGFDLSRGRLDESAHPFTTSLGADDVRITSSYSPKDFKHALFSVIHKCGHALYEMSFDPGIRGTLLADGASLGIHESQSRLWENMIGRSLPFCAWIFERLPSYFPGFPGGLSLNDFYRGINKAAPSLIRIQADELTYSLHIILRFTLEKDLAAGKLEVKHLPEAWNELSRELLGVLPENDAQGCLQDIHWAMGAIGCFPTYALGNLYAAQFFAALRRDIPCLDEDLARGEPGGIREWLAQNIHRHGSVRTAGELLEAAGGGAPDCSWFIRYLTDKYSNIYDI
jgi:carboxypeptidase Taq